MWRTSSSVRIGVVLFPPAPHCLLARKVGSAPLPGARTAFPKSLDRNPGEEEGLLAPSSDAGSPSSAACQGGHGRKQNHDPFIHPSIHPHIQSPHGVAQVQIQAPMGKASQEKQQTKNLLGSRLCISEFD